MATVKSFLSSACYLKSFNPVSSAPNFEMSAGNCCNVLKVFWLFRAQKALGGPGGLETWYNLPRVPMRQWWVCTHHRSWRRCGNGEKANVRPLGRSWAPQSPATLRAWRGGREPSKGCQEARCVHRIFAPVSCLYATKRSDMKNNSKGSGLRSKAGEMAKGCGDMELGCSS